MKEKYFQNSNGVEKWVCVDETQYSNLTEVNVEDTEMFCRSEAPQKPTVKGRIVFKDGSMFNEDGTVNIVEE